MSEHRNAALVRQALGALSAGDMQGVADMLADDVVWHEIGNPEPVRGKAALAARFASAGPDWGTFESSLHDVVANDDHAIALAETTVTRGGRSLRYRTAEIYHVRDGKVTERWAFSDDTAAITEFFA
ncbi:MAG TPA: nuclear transport factor 2 family protein [Candidatus Limnocylindrales bacterium]|nr:nuclear transport factor 2 family protein [Candidatus Limnocylindrales bacterium]